MDSPEKLPAIRRCAASKGLLAVSIEGPRQAVGAKLGARLGPQCRYPRFVSPPSCPFCSPPAERILIESEAALVISDRFPISDGHSLVIPRRHVQSLFDLSEAEYLHIWTTTKTACFLLQVQYKSSLVRISPPRPCFIGLLGNLQIFEHFSDELSLAEDRCEKAKLAPSAISASQ